MSAIQIRLSEGRDVPILQFLWKWKAVTTSALCQKFFYDVSPATGFKRLWELERAAFIETRTVDDHGKQFAWVLTKKGFAAIRSSLPVLREEGFRSENLHHDLLTSAFHLGDWLNARNENATVISEQQLRRYDFEFYPKAVPKTDLHRPDGYTYLASPSAKLIAFEVELSPKKKFQYEEVANFYNRHQVNHILWLVPRESLGLRIHQVIGDTLFQDENRHSFLLLTDFIERSWDAKFFIGPHAGQTVNTLLGNSTETVPKHVSSKFLLDTRKAPHRSGSYRKFSTLSILE